MPTSPADAGFFMPPEWEAHDACWMGWPCPMKAFDGNTDLNNAREAYSNIAGCIAEFEKVFMLARPQDVKHAKKSLGERAEVVECIMDDAWLRDSGPTFLINQQKQITGVDWQFNAWGGKYDYKDDAGVAERVLQYAKVPRFAAPLVMEGGSFHVDGEGTLITTKQCLLNPNRNPHLTQDDIEKYLQDYLGVDKIIWLAGDERDDETDGHVDNVACFVKPGTVLAMEPAGDAVLQENKRQLTSMADARGRMLETVFIPRPQVREHGTDLLASYINFYLPTGGVVMPSFGVKDDDIAKSVIADMFPERQVIQTPALAVVRGGGGIHCITQQQPQSDLL